MSATSNISKALLQKICQLAQKGEFAETLRLTSKQELKGDYALTVIAACSHACYKACTDNTLCDVDALEKLLLLMVSCLEISEEGPLTKYVQAIYHIIKLVVKKEKIENLLRLKPIITPKFINKTTFKIQKLDDIYVALIQMISKSMKQTAELRNENAKMYILQTTELILDAQSKRDKPLDLLNLAQYSLSSLQKLECEDNNLLMCDQYQEFYVMLLKVISKQFGKNQDVTLTIIDSLAPILSSIIAPMIKSVNLDFLENFLVGVELQSKKIFEQVEYVHMHRMYKVIFTILPTATENVIRNAKTILKEVKSYNRKLFNTILSELVRPIIQISVIYKVTKLEIWTGMQENHILRILKFIRDDFIHTNLMLVPSECSCGCGVTKNYEECLRVGWNWNLLLKSYVEKSTNLTDEFHSQLLKWLYLFYEVIKKLKDHNCKLWKEYYSEMASRTYNIGVILYKAGQVAHKNVHICYLKYSLEIEGCSSSLRSVNMSVFAFGCLCDAEQKKNNWATCMGLVALQCILYPEHGENNFLYYWMRSKVKASEDPNNHEDLHTETVVSMLLKQEKQLNTIYNFKHLLTEKRQIALLSFELAQYKAKWQSKKAVLSAFQHVTKLADVPTLTDIVLDIFGDGQITLEDDITSLLRNVIKTMTDFLKKNPSEHQVSLAIAALYYHMFKNLARVATCKNLEEMEKTMQVLESAKKDECIEIVPKDANDECDIVSAYANLRLKSFSETIKSLNKSLDYITAVKSKAIDVQFLKNLPKLLHKIGFEYRLHCYTIKTLQTFETAMQLSKKIGDEEGELFAISFLIESSDIKRKTVLELVDGGDSLVQSLKKTNVDERYSKTIATYHISKSKAFLAAEDHLRAKNSYAVAEAICETHKEKDEFVILQAELHVLRFKLTRSCDLTQRDHQEEPMTTRLHMAYDVACETLKTRVVTSYELCIIFDTAYELTKTYLLMNLPRDLRAYSKNIVVLAQKAILPLRCLKFLVFLAFSDLLSSKYDHCSEKLNGIDDIFSFDRTCAIQKVTSKPIAKTMKNDIDVCSNLIQELVLDLPQNTRQYSPSSPNLRVDGFELPEFIKHEITCTCFFCLSLDLQVLLMEKVRLNALSNMYEENDKLAEDFFMGAMLLYNKLEQKFEHFQKKTSELISRYLLPSFEYVFVETYAHLLYDYSYFMARDGRMNEALDYNLRLINLLMHRKQTYVCLYVDALLQRLCYIKQKDTKVVEGSLVLERTPNQVVSTTPMKTPINKAAVSILVNGTQEHPVPKPKRIVKKCNLFGSDDKSPKFAVPKSKILKNVEFPNPSTPLFSVFSTPRIEIFTDNGGASAVKTYSKKRPVKNNEDNKCNLFDKGNSESGSVFEEEPMKTYTRSRGTKVKSTSEVIDKTKTRTAPKSSKGKGTLVDDLLKNIDKLNLKAAKPDKKNATKNDELLQEVNVDESSDPVDEDILPETPENRMKNGSLRSTLKKKAEPERKAEKTAVGSSRRIAANLFHESTGTRCTGAVRKSTRNRL